MWRSSAAFWTFLSEAFGSLSGLCVWIRPPMTLRGIRITSSIPAGDDDFLVRVELVGVAPVHLQIAEEAVLGAAEREIRHGGGDTDVHADHRRRRHARELPRRLAARGEDRRGVRVRMGVHELDGVLQAL